MEGPGRLVLYATSILDVSFGISADYLQSKRTDENGIYHSCTDARAVDSSVPARNLETAGRRGDAERVSISEAIAEARLALLLRPTEVVF